MDKKNILEFKAIQKKFGDLEILKNINLGLAPGDMVGILGPSGAGKSTLLHIAGLMEKPTGGEVTIDGVSGHHLKEKERAHHRLNTIGFLFQFHYLLPEFDVLENVVMPGRIARDDMVHVVQNAHDILSRLGLEGRLHHRPHQLSGGEQQRTALARALIRKPRILLCDEPTGNLDEHTAQSVWDLIRSEIKRLGMACIVVTHNDRLARTLLMSYHLSDGILSQN